MAQTKRSRLSSSHPGFKSRHAQNFLKNEISRVVIGEKGPQTALEPQNNNEKGSPALTAKKTIDGRSLSMRSVLVISEMIRSDVVLSETKFLIRPGMI